MKRFLLLCPILLAGAAHAPTAHAQTTPSIVIGYVEYDTRYIGGQKVILKNLKFTELKALGSWSFEDKDGQHGYIYVDNAQEAKWENSDLVVPLNGRLFEVNRMQRWKTGEAALIIDDLDEESAALLRQTNWRAPFDSQLAVSWQPLNGAKVLLTIGNRSSQKLRIAPLESGESGKNGKVRASFTLTRDGKPLDTATESAPLEATKSEEASDFRPLEAGNNWQQEIDLSRYADVTQPGHYKVKARYQLPVQNGGTPDYPESVILNFADEFEFDVPDK